MNILYSRFIWGRNSLNLIYFFHFAQLYSSFFFHRNQCECFESIIVVLFFSKEKHKQKRNMYTKQSTIVNNISGYYRVYRYFRTPLDLYLLVIFSFKFCLFKHFGSLSLYTCTFVNAKSQWLPLPFVSILYCFSIFQSYEHMNDAFFVISASAFVLFFLFRIILYSIFFFAFLKKKN